MLYFSTNYVELKHRPDLAKDTQLNVLFCYGMASICKLPKPLQLVIINIKIVKLVVIKVTADIIIAF